MADFQTFLNLIDGESRPAASGAVDELVDPATGQVWASAPASGPEDVDAACRAAGRAFAGWRWSTPAERAAVLLRLADTVEAHAEELVALECANTGKPHASTLTGELPPAVDQLRFFAGAARVLEGRASGEYLRGFTSSVRREPLGPVAAVVPWNYPLLMAVWKLAPALAAGCTVVLKPALTTPASALWLVRRLQELVPPGVVNLVCGGRETGAALSRHPVPRLVAITGSTRAGMAVATAAAADVKVTHLELGGKAPAVVLADADLDAAVAGIHGAGFYNAGQDCTAATRVLAQDAVYDAVVERLGAAARQTRTGPDAGADAFYGPLNNADQLAHVSGLVDRAPAHARVVAGGARVGERGFFYAPTVVADLRPGDELLRTEVFGPVVTVQRVGDLDDAVARANDTPYGLSCSVWTTDASAAASLPARLDFGCVWVNTHIPLAAEMPHGGFAHSGYGKDLSVYSLEGYTRVKHVMQHHGFAG